MIRIEMILLQSPSRYLLQILTNRSQSLDKGVELDCHWVEFDDVRYHIQASIKNPHLLLLSVSFPTPPPETVFFGGLPLGAIEAIKSYYGIVVHILDPPRDSFNLTVRLNLSKLPPDEGSTSSFSKTCTFGKDCISEGSGYGCSIKSNLKASCLKNCCSKRRHGCPAGASSKGVLLPCSSASYTNLLSQVIGCSNLTKLRCLFVEARRTTGLSSAPSCLWSTSPPLDLKEAPVEELSANAGFVSFVFFPRHVEGKKLDKTVWSLSTFHAYVSYHVKCSEGFMHTRMRRRVESLIQALDRAKPDENAKKGAQSKSFKRLSLEEIRGNMYS